MSLRKKFRKIESIDHLHNYTTGKDNTVFGCLTLPQVITPKGLTLDRENVISGTYRTEQMDEHDQAISFRPNTEDVSILPVTDEMIALGAVEVLSRRNRPVSASTEIF